MISCEKDVDIDNKLYDYLKITAIIKNTENLKENKNTTIHYTGFPALLYRSDYWTVTARDPRKITAEVMKCRRQTAGYTWTEYKTIIESAKELNITAVLDKIQNYRRNWLELVNRILCNRLPTILKNYGSIKKKSRGDR